MLNFTTKWGIKMNSLTKAMGMPESDIFAGPADEC